MSQNELRISMLGHLQLGWGDGRSQNNFTDKVAAKNRALLCYLVLNNRLHQREELSHFFWPDKEYNAALANLRVALNHLRTAGLGRFLDTPRTHVKFKQRAAYWCDVQTFEALLTKSRRQPRPDIHALEKAAALYQGEFLHGFSLQELPSFNDWAHQQRQRLDDLMWDALETLIKWAMEETADYEAGIQYAKRSLELAPWRETAHQYLMWLLANTGQQATALTQYERCREALKTYLDAEPTPQTVELAMKIRQHKTVTKPNKKPLPPLRSPEPRNEPPFLAPLQPPHFVGRLESLARLEEMLTVVSNSPRVGIVGMGGIGKTTLALHVAHTLRDRFPDGVLWANVVDEQPEEIATHWAAAYGYDLSQQNSGEERLAAVSRLLATKQALLILDDVWAGARIRHLLPEEGRCAVLITSRAENIVRNVAAMPVSLDQFSLENGRRLLLHHVDETRAMADPTAIDEICQLVGNLPLAISIAGSYLQYRPHRTLADFVTQLKKQIKPLDLSEDAQRVRETFELSWAHLDGDQSRLFALLGLFAGRTFSLQAIAQIANMDIFFVEDKLEELVQLSLLGKQTYRRYRQHGLLAEYAEDKLEDDGFVRDRYVGYFANFAEHYATDYEKLKPEWGNLDSAVQFAESAQQWEAILQFTAVLKDAWFARGRFQQARDAFKIAFHAAVRLESDPRLAQNWLWWGQACLEQGDQAEARKWLQKALDLYNELEDGIGIANAEYELARIDIDQMLLDEAGRRLERALALRQTEGDEQGAAATLSRYAKLRHRQGDNEAARVFALEAVSRQQAVGDEPGRCKTLRFLVFIMIGLGQLEMAHQYGEESLALAQKLDDLGEIAMAKKGLATVLRRLKRLKEANQLAEESYGSLLRMGDAQSMAAVRFLQCLIKRSEENYEDAFALAEESLAEFTRLKDELHVAYCLTHLGDFYEIFGDWETAVQKWQAALRIAHELSNDDVVGKINGRLSKILSKQS